MASQPEGDPGVRKDDDGVEEPDPKRARISEEEEVRGPFADIDPLTSGQEDQQPEKRNKLSWREDPNCSLSDWTIVVTNKGNRTSTNYHVHKNVLAAGSSKSDYFRSLFHGRFSLEESKNNISFEEPAANAFPCMLDYMYEPSKSVFTVKNAVALRHLAQYFGIRNLFVDVSCFIKESLAEETCEWQVRIDFLQEAAYFKDEALLSFVADAMACAIKNCDECNCLATLSQPLLIKVFESPSFDGQCSSKVIADLCKHCDEAKKLDWATFKALTSKQVVSLGSEGCLDLLQHCLEFKNNAIKSSHMEVWNDLYDRCSKACAHYWREYLVSPLRSQLSPEHRKLPMLKQISLLECGLCEADGKLAAMSERVTALQSDVARLEAENESFHKIPVQGRLTAHSREGTYYYGIFPVYYKKSFAESALSNL